MDRRQVMVVAARTQAAPPPHGLASRRRNRLEIRVRSTQAAAVMDGDREYARNVASERDDAGIGSKNRRTGDGCDVDAPVAGIPAHGGVWAHDLSGYRRCQPGTNPRRDQEHRGSQQSDARYHDSPVPPSRTRQ